jgi:hypothetical protein
MMDVYAKIREHCSINEVIKACGVGNFPNQHRDQKYRGAHGTHGSNTDLNQVEISPSTNSFHCFSCGAHGGPEQWVLHAKFDGNENRMDEAIAWLSNYFDFDLEESPVDNYRYRTHQLLTDLASDFNKRLFHPDNIEVKDWIQNNWGIEDATLQSLCIGYADVIPDSISLLDKTNAGIINKNGICNIYGRIIFPYFKDSQVRWMSGRYFGTPGEKTPKYAALSETGYVTSTLYNYDNAFNQPPREGLAITEGLFDVAMAYQCGIRAIGINSTHVSYNNIPDLVRICRQTDTTYIVMDSEENNAGYKGSLSVAQLLVDKGFDPYIIKLPRPSGVNKVDLCDFLRNNGGGKVFSDMIYKGWDDGGRPMTAKTLAEIAIEECPNNPTQDRLKSVVKTFANLGEALTDKYSDALAAKIKATKVSIKKVVGKEKATEPSKLELDEQWVPVPFMAQGYEHFTDLGISRAHRVAFVPAFKTTNSDGKLVRTNTFAAYYLTTDVSSDGRYQISNSQLINENDPEYCDILPARASIVKPHINHFPWSFGQKPFSVVSFLKGVSPPINLADLYKRIHRLFSRFVWYPDGDNIHLLVIYVMFTYVFMDYKTAPYLHITGQSGSGKTTTSTLISYLCFNAVAATSVTGASLFRTIESCRPTFIIDEFNHKSGSAMSEDAQLIQSICLGGNFNGLTASAIRTEGHDVRKQKDFNTYGPKIFIGVTNLDSMLRTRCIVINCVKGRTEEKLIQMLEDIGDTLNGFRDELHVMGMTLFPQFKRAFKSINSAEMDEKLGIGRISDVWYPLLAIAEVVEQDLGYSLQKILIDLANRKKNYEASLADLDFGLLVLYTLDDILTNAPQDIPLYNANNKTYIPTSIAADVVLTKLRLDKKATEKNTLSPSRLVRFLKDVQASPFEKKSVQVVMDIPGKGKNRVSVTEFNHKKLREVLAEREILEELMEEPTEEQGDEMVLSAEEYINEINNTASERDGTNAVEPSIGLLDSSVPKRGKNKRVDE